MGKDDAVRPMLSACSVPLLQRIFPHQSQSVTQLSLLLQHALQPLLSDYRLNGLGFKQGSQAGHLQAIHAYTAYSPVCMMLLGDLYVAQSQACMQSNCVLWNA